MSATLRTFLLFLAFLGLSTTFIFAGPVLILDYHTFLGTHTSSLDFSDQEITEQLTQIAKMGYSFVRLNDAIAGKSGDKLAIVITIDDGNHSVFQAWQSVFKPLGISPFLFIYPHAVDLSRFTLKSGQIHLLQKEGLDMGAHGYFHKPMGAEAWKKNPESVRVEAFQGLEPLTALLGYRPTLFAYPYGVAPPPVQDLVKSAGYTWAFAANDKIIPVDFSDPSLNHYYVPRTIVYRWNVKRILKYLKAGIQQDKKTAEPQTVDQNPPVNVSLSASPSMNP